MYSMSKSISVYRYYEGNVYFRYKDKLTQCYNTLIPSKYEFIFNNTNIYINNIGKFKVHIFGYGFNTTAGIKVI